MRYVSVRPSQEPLKSRIREIAAARVSYGYRRVHVLLRREGWPINLKRVLRLYREQGLCLRSKRPKRRRSAVARIERPAGVVPNERWSMDFMSDALASGHKLRVLTVLDTCTRECVALEVATGFGGQQVADVLTRVGITRGLPAVITVDNGTEFTSRALDHWAYRNGVKLDYIRPGKPTENGFIESFNAAVRRECLSQHYFVNVVDARCVLSTWRDEYNNARPHRALGQLPPAQYRRQVESTGDRKKLALRRA